MDLDWKPVTTDKDYSEAMRLRNIDHPHMPLTVSELREFDAIQPKELPWLRFLGRKGNGSVVARISLRAERSDEKNAYSFDINLQPDVWSADRWSQALELVEEEANRMGAAVLIAAVNSTHEEALEVASKRGYRVAHRNPLTFLDLTRFDISPYRELLDRLKHEGLEIISLRTYRDLYADTWNYDLWRLNVDLARDVPTAIPFEEWPFEEQCEWVSSPLYTFDTRVVAHESGRLAGLSEFNISAADRTQAATYLTGVRREYRRRGIARALKAVALNTAKELGATSISTDNEVDNPMYQLNLQLGFVRKFDWVVIRREL